MATKNLVPRNSGEGGIGRLGKPWATGFYDALYLNEVLVTGLDSNKMDGFTMNQNLNTSDNIVFASGNFSDGLTVNGINVLTGIHRTGQMLDEEVDAVAANLVITGSFLHDQIISNDSDLTTLTTNLNTTGQLLDEEVDSVASNLVTTGLYLHDRLYTPTSSGTQDLGSPSKPFRHVYTEAASLYLGETKLWVNEDDALVLGLKDGTMLAVTSGTQSTKDNLNTTGETLQANINTLSNNVVTTGSFLHDQITSNDNDFSTLTTNLNTTGQLLDEEVDSVAANLVISGSFLHDQITSNDTDVSTLTTNLNTTGQLLDEEVDSVAANLVTSGSFLHNQVISNDSDVSTLTTNLNTTGQLLDEEVDSVAANLIITGSKIKWQESAGNIFYNEGGRVGIGTQNPQTTLHVTGDVYIGGNLTVTGTTTTIDSVTLSVDDKNIELGSVDSPSDVTADGGGITLKGTTDKTILFENDTDSWDFSEHVTTADGKHILTDKIKARDGDGLHLVDDANNGIFIEDGGMVGVGKADPQALLHVGGKAIVDGNLEVSGIIPSLVTTGSFLHNQISTLTTNLNTTGQLLDEEVDSVAANLIITGSFLHNEIGEGGKWTTGVSAGDIYYSGGNVGIGTTSPTGLLHLINTDDSVQDIFVVEDSSHFDETRFVINNSGQVGIQQPDPDHDLHVGTGEFSSFMVTTGGLVGIGTDNPSAKLHVNSDGLVVSGFRMTDGNQANNRVLTCDADGNASWKASQGGSSSELVTTGSFLHNQILSNDSDITTLTTNLNTTGQLLDEEVDSVAANLVTTGSFVHNQIISNDSDITTLTSNLVTTGSFVHDQILSNDSDISTLTANTSDDSTEAYVWFVR